MERLKQWTSPFKRYSDHPRNPNPSVLHRLDQHRTGQHTSGDNDKDRPQGETEERVANHERTLSVGELLAAYESFKSNDTPAPKRLDVVRYVELLRTENNDFNHRCWEAENVTKDHDALLRKVSEDIESTIQKLYPRAMDRMGERGKPTISAILDFLLEQHESEWNESRNLRRQLRKTKENESSLQQRLLEEEDLHRKDVARVKEDWRNQVHSEQIAHKRQIASLEEGHKEQIRENEGRHNEEVRLLIAGYDKKLRSQETEYEEKLRKQKNELENDIGTLQRGLLTVLERFEPIPDNKFQTRFDELKSLVVTLSRGAFDAHATKQGDPLRKYRKYLLESTLWTILVDGIFSTPFKVLGDYGEYLAVVWSQLFGEKAMSSQTSFIWPGLGSLSEKWRYATLEPLREVLTKDMGKHPAYEEVRRSYEINVSRVSEALAEALRQVTSQINQADIHDIVDKACLLALDFGVQRCRLQVVAPQPNDTISTATTGNFSDVNGENDLGLESGVVQLMISPGLRRSGDARGGQLESVIASICPTVLYLKTVSRN